MITPEDVYNFSFDTIDWGPPPRQAAVVNLGKSDWLNKIRSDASRPMQPLSSDVL